MDHLRSVLGGSIAFVVLVPTLVGTALPSEPKRSTAAVTVQLSRPGQWPSHTNPAYVAIVTKGLGPKEPTRLVDKSGRHAVLVTPMDGGMCQGDPYYTAGNATDHWCIKVDPVPLATEVSGTLSGAATDLTLTVDARRDLLTLPALVIALALLAAVALALAPGRLKTMVAGAKVWIELGQNGTGGRRKIQGLEEWAKRRLARGATPTDLVKAIAGVIASAPATADAARDRLQANLPGLSPNHPLHALAVRESGSQELAIGDFLDDDGAPAVHPAAALAEVVVLVKDAFAELTDLEQRIVAGLNPPYRGAPLREVESARRAVGQVTSRHLAEVARRDVDIAWSAYMGAIANPNATQGLAAPGAEDAGGVPAGMKSWFTAVAAPVSADATGSITKALALTLVFAAVVLVAAVASVLSATYIGKPTWGSPADVLALALAAFGSAAAGTVATVVAYWSLSESG